MWYNLMTDEEREDTEFVINLSYGKDSLAAIHVAVDILKIPIWLIRIVHAEVWATDTIPADLPPMVEFKRWADGFIKGCWGLTAEQCGMTATTGGRSIEKSTKLSTQVYLAEQAKLIPTPTANCHQTPCEHGEGGLDLATYTQLVPTPIASDWKNCGCKDARQNRQCQLQTTVGGQLNPTWVEWLMGFPLGWTDLDASETPSCLSSSTPSSEL